MTQQFSDNDLVFVSAALGQGDLFLTRLEGREALSNLFEFDLIVETTFNGALDFEQVDDMFGLPAYIAFGHEEQHKIHGVVRSVDMLASADAGNRVAYRVVLVPRLWYATQTIGTWAYQDMSVPEVIKDVLGESGLNDGDDYELRLTGSYRKREWISQHEESDFDFISRLMEHEGIFYFFEHTDTVDKLIISDGNTAFLELEGHEGIRYDPRTGVTDPGEVVLAISRHREITPATVFLKDYNYRTPSIDLFTGVEIDATGKGTQIHYGDHFKDISEGKKLAKIRAQEIYVPRETYNGRSRVRGLRTGHKFALAEHPIPAMDQAFIVTELRHSATQQSNANAVEGAGYTNEFVLIPLRIPFRPRRVTPKPRIAGFMNAKIDGAASADGTAPVDETGRYKVSLIADNTSVTRNGGGSVSHWVRMAQPFSGDNYGMHFPLHVGTEVLIAFVNGDPDRPVIAASIPNAENQSPIGTQNAQVNRIRTRSGIMMGFHDRKE